MKYKPNYPQILREYAETHEYFGACIPDIQKLFGISRCTVYQWMESYPDFKAVVDEIRDKVDTKVENALLKSALGYDYDESKVVREGLEKDSKILQVIMTRRHKAPDVTAGKFWLINRKGDAWKEKQSVENSGMQTIYISEKDTDMY